MISLEWNVFAGGVRFAQADEARSRVREARYNREAALLQARAEVETSRQEILDAQRALRSGERLATLAEQNRNLVRTQYELGVADQTLLLDSDRERLNARIQLVQARLRLTLAALSWSKSVGAFLERIDGL
jgi:outer membrane protein TolC